MIKININITFTKAFSFIVLIVGCVFAYMYGNAEVIIFTLSLAAGLAGLKNWSDSRTEQKRIEFPTPGGQGDPNPTEKDPSL